ncbi:phosphodiester glycosidase family protein [Lachnoclostridium phytofermentans]|uniref:phosphodiester glycosidase family protein n=1 Tax=Lachnoclostridium phytofermentans TaxID=66219 RepID=UPI0009DE9542|nr:phosphodiester glycosidase family protein [Lachnoclostridium phytofermentans]
MKKYLGVIIFSVLLLSFTVYIALDTFVITRVYTHEQDSSEQDITQNIDNNSYSLENSSKENADTEKTTNQVVITGNTYSDDNINITLTQYREYDTSIYVADVTLSSAEYLQTALAQNAYGRNVTEKTSKIAAENHAILAINGDYYGAQEKGYVLRNGVIYRDFPSKNQEDLVINKDGSFKIITEGDVSASELLKDGAVQILSFGPALLNNGEIAVTQEEEVGKSKASNPRTAIAVVDDLHYLFVVSDGRTNESEGLSLYELAEFVQGLGAKTAYNLDGGGSSTMYFNGEIINNPTTNGKSIQERSVSDIVFIGNE